LCATFRLGFSEDPTGFPTPHLAIRPYIFTREEIWRLLQAADRLGGTVRSPLRRETFRLAVVLLYTSGLRRGELVRLTIADYDPQDRTLLTGGYARIQSKKVRGWMRCWRANAAWLVPLARHAATRRAR
jgi:integrase